MEIMSKAEQNAIDLRGQSTSRKYHIIQRYLLLIVLTLFIILRATIDKPSLAAILANSSNRLIAFASERDGTRELYVMNDDGSRQHRLTNGFSVGQPRWSPNGQYVAVTSNPHFYIFEIAPATTKILTGSGINDWDDFAWSPDGKQFVYTAGQSSGAQAGSATQIYIMGSDGANNRQITSTTTDRFSPNWSPDGQYIVFSTVAEGRNQIEIISVNDSNRHLLTHNSFNGVNATWSPDGQQILFLLQGEKQTPNQVRVMSADGSNEYALANCDYEPPSWSPDGKLIAFVFNQQIWVMAPDGSNQRNLSNNTFQDYQPTWSPDGKQIAFTSNRDGTWQIYVMNVDNPKPHQLTSEGAVNFMPAWSP